MSLSTSLWFCLCVKVSIFQLYLVILQLRLVQWLVVAMSRVVLESLFVMISTFYLVLKYFLEFVLTVAQNGKAVVPLPGGNSIHVV